MPRYDQTWTEEAEDNLAEIWKNSSDRAAIVRATARIEDRLSNDPYRYGNPLSEGLWEITAIPLRVYFQVDDDARHVTVHHVNEVG